MMQRKYLTEALLCHDVCTVYTFLSTDSIREIVDRRVKLSIKRLVNYETRKEKLENRVLVSFCYVFNVTKLRPC